MTLQIVDPNRTNKKRDYVSFSEVHLFFQCPYKHDKAYNLGERDEYTFYTVFGSTIHEAIEQKWKHKNDLAWLRMGKIIHVVSRIFADENGKFSGKTPSQWVKAAFRIYVDFFVFIEENFPDCELYDIEMKLEEEIENFDRKFLGYIDLILYDPKKDIYHIIDLKTSGWGWGKKQLSDTKKLYQVILYKHFFCKKMKVDPKKVHTHYLLLLRNPAKSERLAIKLHSTTSGAKKVQNSVDWLNDTIKKIKMGIKLKTPATCSFCICGKTGYKKKR